MARGRSVEAHLDVSEHVRFDRGEGDGPEGIYRPTVGVSNEQSLAGMVEGQKKGPRRTKHSRQGLGSVEELRGRNGIVMLGIDGDVDERFAEGREQGGSLRDNGGRHDGWWCFYQDQVE